MSIECIGGAGLDIPALIRREEVPAWFWANDAIFYFRVFIKLEDTEKLTIPAGTFDAARMRVKIDVPTLFPSLPSWAARSARLPLRSHHSLLGFERSALSTTETRWPSARRKRADIRQELIAGS